MSNLLLMADVENLCTETAIQNVLYLVAWVYVGIRIVVPIILIIMGMISLVQGIAEQDDKKLKEAQKSLVKKAVAALIVFLVVTIVGLLMKLIGGTEYKDCMDCVTKPAACDKNFSYTGE